MLSKINAEKKQGIEKKNVKYYFQERAQCTVLPSINKRKKEEKVNALLTDSFMPLKPISTKS